MHDTSLCPRRKGLFHVRQDDAASRLVNEQRFKHVGGDARVKLTSNDELEDADLKGSLASSSSTSQQARKSGQFQRKRDGSSFKKEGVDGCMDGQARKSGQFPRKKNSFSSSRTEAHGWTGPISRKQGWMDVQAALRAQQVSRHWIADNFRYNYQCQIDTRPACACPALPPGDT